MLTFNKKVTDNINSTAIAASIPTIILVESHIPAKHLDILLSTNGSAIAELTLKIIITINDFIKGTAHIEIIIKTPTKPKCVFRN